MGWISFCADLVNRIPWERVFVKEPDKTESLKKLQQIMAPSKLCSSPVAESPKPTVRKIPSIRGVPDSVLMKDARQRLKDEGIKLRYHLSSGCQISGIPCDCCEKGMINLAHALEDILAIQPNDGQALSLQEWVFAHREELAAYAQLDKKRGLEMAAELRLLLKACGAIVEAPLRPTLLPPAHKLLEAKTEPQGRKEVI